MNYFFCKLLPPRPTFPADMTPVEAALMQAHGVYWRGQLERGFAVAFGPVADPKGVFGVCIVELPAGVDPRAIANDDPVIKANAGFTFEIYPMPTAVVRK
jgi:uncharacterized protein